MKHDLADHWGARLLKLEAQLQREAKSAMTWHWRGEIRVLRFLLARYGQTQSPELVELAVPDDAATSPTSALERSLLRLALLIPNVATKHPRPQPRERAEILERIKCARDEGRRIEDEEESWRAAYNQQLAAMAQVRRNALSLRERQGEWAQLMRKREERERRR